MSDTHDLPSLFRAVDSARSAVGDARRQPLPGGPAVLGKQEELLRALERCDAELRRRGQPLPYRLRNEVTMYRLMLGPDRPKGRAG